MLGSLASSRAEGGNTISPVFFRTGGAVGYQPVIITLPEGGSDEQRGRIISEAIADQAKLVREIDPNPDPEMMTTLYAEVGRFYDRGWITVPEGVTIGFADAGMSGMSYSKRFWTEPRDPKRKYGQYFHTQYFGGGPQIAKCTNIEKYLMVNIGAMLTTSSSVAMLPVTDSPSIVAVMAEVVFV